ncbi:MULTISPECIES: hypothetical protein [unclassified Halorhabdus]|nr:MULTISPECIES: hypothetical protein [unclassified Halorhabdus]WEL16751.1 Uncharacterized protein SVXHr_0572 [Halorhabdus sp. SVX81]WEL20623.1 Uncharacterized protein HBNXHr_0550 [Halorhabdus sp. BNX81]
MKRNVTIDARGGQHDRPDVRLTVEIAGRRLVYAESDLESVGFTANEL